MASYELRMYFTLMLWGNEGISLLRSFGWLRMPKCPAAGVNAIGNRLLEKVQRRQIVHIEPSIRLRTNAVILMKGYCVRFGYNYHVTN